MQATLCVQLLRDVKLKQEIRQGKAGGKETTTEGGGLGKEEDNYVCTTISLSTAKKYKTIQCRTDCKIHILYNIMTNQTQIFVYHKYNLNDENLNLILGGIHN
jgi:hypothetical protein